MLMVGQHKYLTGRAAPHTQGRCSRCPHSVPSLGFSLIELMVTLGVMSILAAVSAPNFSSWISGKRADAVAQKIVGAFKLARSESVSLASDVTMTWNPNTGQINVTEDVSGETLLSVAFDASTISVIDDNEDDSVTFSALGRPGASVTMGVCVAAGVSKGSVGVGLSNIGRVSLSDNSENSVISC